MRVRGIVLGLVLALGLVHPAAAEPVAPSDTIGWDASSVSTPHGTAVRLTGTFAVADETEVPTVTVERRDGEAWVVVESTTTERTFAATVPGAAGQYRATLAVGDRTTTSTVASVRTTPARSELRLSLPARVRDKQRVVVNAAWTSTTRPTGRVVLEIRRRGTTAWKRFTDLEVRDGTGRVTITPRDDGDFRLRFGGDARFAAVVSTSRALDNVPIKKLALRLGQLNVPGPDKLKWAPSRAKRAAAQIRTADLDVVTLNEAVGPGRNGWGSRPSAFAESIRRSLGSRWRLITPTTAYNENYVLYRADRLGVIAQHPDRIVPGVGSGKARQRTARHVTSVLFKDGRSNQPVLVLGTHLVNDDRFGARVQSRTVADQAKRRSAGYPVVVGGDMNTSERLTALTGVGLKDARRSAAKASGASWSTYTRYSATKPRRSASWIIDQLYVPSSWTVSRWTTVVDTRKGRFVKPRASDHTLVWVVAHSRA